MEVDIQLKKEDWNRFIKYIQRKKQKGLKGVVDGFWKNLILWCSLTLIFIFLFKTIQKFHYPTALFMFFLFASVWIIFILNMVRLQKALAPSEKGIFIGKHQFSFDESGIHTKNKGSESHYKWDAVLSSEYANGMVLIYLDTAHALIFPESQIGDPDTFLNKINGFKV